jgi:Icc-related predicted phosphoesterase
LPKPIRILFATDLHGSRRAFVKFLNGLKVYRANVGIIGGDLTGKVMVPIIKQDDGTFVSEFNGLRHHTSSENEFKEMVMMIEDSGYYHLVVSKGDNISSGIIDLVKDEKVFKELIAERLKEWIQIAKTKLEETGIKVYITGGNDDYLELDHILEASDSMIFSEDRIQIIEGDHEMISSGYSNITPWKCPRDISEEQLYSKIASMASKVSNMKSAIFNLHVPPIGTALDVCTKLDTSVDPPRPIMGEETSGGSTAVREAIEEFQPLLSLHGHIHESRGVEKIGRTMCFNPGSEYGEGILRSVVVNVSKEKVESFQFLSG